MTVAMSNANLARQDRLAEAEEDFEPEPGFDRFGPWSCLTCGALVAEPQRPRHARWHVDGGEA